MSTFAVRRATPADRAALFRVCLETGNAGEDATALYPTDPEGLGAHHNRLTIRPHPCVWYFRTYIVIELLEH